MHIPPTMHLCTFDVLVISSLDCLFSLGFPRRNAGETCCLLRVDLKSLCISSCLRPTLKKHPLINYDHQEASINQLWSPICQFFKNRSAKIWGPMSPSWFLDILCSFSSWCANTSTSLTSSSEVFGMLPFVTHVIHVEASKILRNFVEICQRLSPRLQIYAPYAAIPIHLQKQSRRIAHRNNRLFGRMSA